MDAQFKTNMKEFRNQVREYGKRLTDEGIKRAAVDLSHRASNAVKRDFTKYLKQGSSPTMGASAGQRVSRTGHLRDTVQPTIKNDSQFGVSSKSAYARVHELGIGPYPIRVKNKKFLRWPTSYGIKGKMRGIGMSYAFAKKVMHPGQKARHWISEPMYKELQVYIKDQITKLEKPL